MLNSGFAAGLGEEERDDTAASAAALAGKWSPAAGPWDGGGRRCQPGRASAGRCGGSCVAMTGRGRPETLTLRGKKPICDLDF